MFNLREWDVDQDYERIRHWWDDPKMWGQPPSKRTLSQKGVLAELHGDPIAAIFIFESPSTYCLITGAVCDGRREKSLLHKALFEVTRKAFDYTRSIGKSPRLYIKTPGYISALTRGGLLPSGPKRHSLYISPVYLPFLAEFDG